MSNHSILKSFLILIAVLQFNISFGQSAGDTIFVQAFNFESLSRDSVISFPSDDNLTYEKILLKYTMRCKDGLVSTPTERNRGCGEWDFSCNTYLIDSTKAENLPSTIASHFITNYDEDNFEYLDTPVFDYLRSTQQDVQIVNTISENAGAIGTGTEDLNNVISTNTLAGRSQYLYTATELNAAGMVAGEIQGLSLQVSESTSEERFFEIKMQSTTQSVLNELEEFGDDTRVFFKKQKFDANTENRFQFSAPFNWDGTSNVLVEYQLSNAETPLGVTSVAGEATAENMGLAGVNEQDVMLLNNGYIECDDYFGVEGTQNRTIEAWVKTTNGGNGEIMQWGRNITGQKYTLRFTNGVLRIEVHGGGTVGSTRVDDGEWHHIALVLDGDNLTDIRFYIDGVLDTNSTTGTTAISSETGTNKLRINRGLGNRYFEATMDEIRLWDTDLSQETINQWMNLKVDDSHPNYENLQLYYELEGTGNKIIDSSPFERDATLIGDRFSISEVNADALFKNFEKTNSRPSATFFQGEYETELVETIIDMPISKTPRHLVIERTIVPGDPNVAIDDEILINGPRELWAPISHVFDAETGLILETIDLEPIDVINITELDYVRRFPFYNELVSFVTPYGIGLDFGQEGASWVLDMSDYASILKGDKRLQLTLGGQWQEDMDLEFQFIVGTPPRDVIQYEQIWQGTNRIGIANINQILDEQKFQPFDLTLSDQAETFTLKSSITGHGSEGEFQQNGGVVNHIINVNQTEEFNWRIHKECSFNPIFPQGGTWVYDRQGWCPGERSLITEHDLTSIVSPGETITLDYNTTAPSNSGGDYRYHVAHQLVAYGAPNFQTDAAVTNVMAPNNAPEFTRIGTVCADPIIVIQNTGAEELTNLQISYWLNDSQAPQTFEWSGSLEFMEKAEVVVPSPAELWYDLLTENNKFHVEINAPNGGADEYSFNNTFTSSFDFPEILPSNMILEFRTNNIPAENSYELFDADGNLVGSNNLSGANTTFTDNFELADGCYKLVVRDSGGDGVEWWANPGQGTGFIRILADSGIPLKIFEPDFGGGFEYSFSTTFPVSSEDLEFLTSIELFPNPASDFVSVKGENLSEATIYLVNSMGQKVSKNIVSLNSNIVKLDLAEIGSGIFYVVIEKEELMTTRKLVIH